MRAGSVSPRLEARLPQPARAGASMRTESTVRWIFAIMASSIAGRRPPDGRSNERGLQHDAPVDDPGCLIEDAGRLRRNFVALGKLAKQVDQPPHRADQVAFVAAER